MEDELAGVKNAARLARYAPPPSRDEMVTAIDQSPASDPKVILHAPKSGVISAVMEQLAGRIAYS